MRARFGTALTTAALLVLTSWGVVAAPAEAAGSGSITGVVTVPDGYDVRAVRVAVMPTNAVNAGWTAFDWTDASGAFELPGLADGTYYVGFGTYWSDMNTCDGRDRLWSGPGDPAGTCIYHPGPSTVTVEGAQAVAVTDGAATALGTVPVLGTLPTYDVTGTLVAPPGESVAGMKVELWVKDETFWVNEISGGWYRLTSVPVRTVDASGTFSFTLVAPLWNSTYAALRVVDAGHGYTFSFSNAGLSSSTPGLGGADFAVGSVGLHRLPSSSYADTDVTLQLKHEIGYVSGGVTISGSPAWGRTLTAHADTVWSQAGVGTQFQWLRNGAVLEGATGPTYVLNAYEDGPEFGATISVRALPQGLWAYNGPTIDSPTVTVVKGTPLNVVAPTVKGSPVAGQRLTATPGSWRPTAPTYAYTYRWFRGSAVIAGATAATYDLTAKDAGQRISVEVTADRAGCTGCDPWFTSPGVARSGATAAVVLPAMPTTWIARWPVKVGATQAKAGKKVAVGKAVVATAGKAARVRLGYQWFVGGKAVRGATKPSLAVKRAWKRKAVVVRVTATAPGHQSRYRIVRFGKVR